MVKIKIRSILISLVIFIFLMNVAYAASKLTFSDVDVKVGSRTSKNLENGETIDDEAEPGDSVEFRVEMQSNFTSEEDLDIEDIQVEVTIEDIDDGDELDEESNEFDLSPGRDKRVTLKFQVPIEVDEDTFDVLIHAEGRDENGTKHLADMRLKLDVDKESHLLKITRKSLSPEEVSCNRKNVQLATTFINIGSEDEDEVTFQVLSPDLGVDFKESVEDLEAEPNEDSSRFSKIFTFNVPNNVEAGSYPITIRALYDDDRKKTEDTVTLTINDCATAKPKPAEEEAEEEEEVEVVSPPSVVEKPPVVVVPPGTTVTEESFFKSNAFVVGVIIAEIIVVILGIILIVALFARRD